MSLRVIQIAAQEPLLIANLPRTPAPRSLMPNEVTIWRAMPATCWMSPPGRQWFTSAMAEDHGFCSSPAQGSHDAPSAAGHG